MRLALREVALLVPVLATVACGGGGGGDAGVVNPSPDPVTASFQADDNSPGANSVGMLQGTHSADLVTVRVTVTNTTGVYGAAFDVTYDVAKVGYVSWSAGTLLEQGGHLPTYTVSDNGAGRVVVAASRNGSVGTVNASGTVDMIKLTFRMKVVGESRADFGADPILYDGQNPPAEKASINWYAGSLVGTP